MFNIQFDPATCIAKLTQPDSVVVTGGTGKYTHASGAGAGIVHVTAIAGRNSDGTCQGPDSPPIFEFVIANGTTTLNLS